MALIPKRLRKTTYASAGEPAPPQATNELGSSIAVPIREVVPDLLNKRSELRTYFQMATFHAPTRASLRAVKASVLGADFYMEPCNDDQESQDIAEFVEYNIFEATSSPWLVTLSRILKMLDNGYQAFEHVFENREWRPQRKGSNAKTYTMLKKLAPRPALSIARIEYDDNGGPVRIVQNALRGYYSKSKIEEITIPIEKAIIFTYDEEGGDLMGKSILRSAYPHWYYSQHLYKIDAIQKERHGTGVPRGKMPPGVKNENEKKTARQMLRDIRTNEHSGILQPDGWEFDFMKIEGQMVNVIASIEHHNAMIMLNVLAEFLISGLMETGGGGRATSASQQDIFLKANRALADLICSSFNLYLIPLIVGYNFDTDEYPKLKVRNIGDTRDLQQLASALASVLDKELITPDLPTEQWARRIFDMPAKVGERPALSATQIRELIQVKDGTSTPAGPTGPGGNGNASTVGKTGGQGNMGKGTNVT